MRALLFDLATPLSVALVAAMSPAACGSETGDSSGHVHSGAPGGPVAGAADTHCGATVQKTSQAACIGGGTGGAAGAGSTAGAGGAGGAGGWMSGYGETLHNAEGDDDDCKYHFELTSTDVYKDEDVAFTVTIASKLDGSPVKDAKPYVEAFLNDTHPAPNSDQKATETSDGTYEVGAVRFDASGRWTVRFHVFDECSDLSKESPHGHVAFYIDVP